MNRTIVTPDNPEGIVVELTAEEVAEYQNREQAQKEAYALVEYMDKRREAYPSIGDQLDMIYHAGQGGDEFQAAIKAVKDAHPKPE